jgi:protein TonB
MKWLLAALTSLSINGILLALFAELRMVEKKPLPPPVHFAVNLIVKETQVASAPPASEIILPPVVEKSEPPVQVLTTPKAAPRTVPPPAPKKPKPEKPIKEKPVKKAEPPVPEPAHQFKKAAPIPPTVAKNPAPAPQTAVKNPIQGQGTAPRATGHEAAATKPATGSGQNSTPKPLVRVEPIYPRMAKAQGITGSVVVEFTITTTGDVENIQIIKADPEDVFEEAVEQALAQWQFSPQREQGVAVARRARQTIRFDLKNNGN